ncbi:hypothetical protein [Methylocystis parvus]|uniref:hypothetical protein n=1 Tax=Methylocystis parvus TaxID=134 RepID=UPI003C737DA7
MRFFAFVFLLLPSIAIADDITPDSFANRLKADALKLTVSSVLVQSQTLYMQGTPMGDPEPLPARISYTIENNSGIPLGMAIKRTGVTAGPCAEVESGSGIELFDDALAVQLQRNKSFRDRVLRLVPDKGRVSGTIMMEKWGCKPSDVTGMTTVPVTITVVIANENNFLAVPLQTDAHLTVRGN